MVCLDARQAQRALDMRANKTDANDADGLAHLVRAGWYKEVRVKSRDAMLSKAVSAARRQLLDISTNLSNQVRGLMKTFGLVVPKGKGRTARRQLLSIFRPTSGPRPDEDLRPCRAQGQGSAGSSMRNTPWQLSSYRFWKLGAPSATVPPSSTGSCSVRCATTRIAGGSCRPPASAPSSLPPMSLPSSCLPTSSTPDPAQEAHWVDVPIGHGPEVDLTGATVKRVVNSFGIKHFVMT